jgi:hypothetical protein
VNGLGTNNALFVTVSPSTEDAMDTLLMQTKAPQCLASLQILEPKGGECVEKNIR